MTLLIIISGEHLNTFGVNFPLFRELPNLNTNDYEVVSRIINQNEALIRIRILTNFDPIIAIHEVYNKIKNNYKCD